MSENIGKKIANQLGSRITAENQQDIANQKRASLNERIRKSFTNAVTDAINGFNESIEPGISLALVPAETQLIFNLNNRLTLTVRFRDQKIDVSPSTKSANPMPFSASVSEDDSGFNYQIIPSNPTVVTPVLTQDVFIEGVIRLALDQPFSS